MPHFYKGYDKHLDLTEDEWLEREMYDSMGEYEAEMAEAVELVEQDEDNFEGEPFEDTYLPGIPDYDRFNRPSWES
jgi:hypothetical protein